MQSLSAGKKGTIPAAKTSNTIYWGGVHMKKVIALHKNFLAQNPVLCLK